MIAINPPFDAPVDDLGINPCKPLEFWAFVDGKYFLSDGLETDNVKWVEETDPELIKGLVQGMGSIFNG